MKTRVYLAGGMKSGWQEKVKKEMPNFEYYDPRDHGLTPPSEYTVWDLHHVKSCDIVFAYMEESNPSGYGLSLEIGYAKALGKTIILVDEKSGHNERFSRMFAMIRQASDCVFYNLEDGLDHLSRYK